MNSRDLGKIGESLVIADLEKQGYHLVARNFQLGHLEIDVICENDTHLLFVEVKSRMVTDNFAKYGRPATAVTYKKRQNLQSAAESYLYRHPTKKKPRIDVAEVYLQDVGGQTVLDKKGIHYIKNALI